jgi:exodeoxyribonuclease VII large subunit
MPQPPPLPERKVYTVSRLNREVGAALRTRFPLLWVEGEISNLARPRSGHLYFTLKDAEAQLRCAMFRGRNLLLDFAPRDGMQVLVRGRVGLYETRGEFQLTVEHMEEAGAGALQRAFEALKRRLAQEGLFDTERKRALPGFVSRLGVITSPSGAAIRDILSVLRRRFPALPVLIYPVPVQGEGAAQAIARAVETANRRGECDLLLLARGGGSLEDLWAFNEEVVARAIAASRIPVVTGIGHEIDFTIADFAADRRAPTPSAAAELISQEKGQLSGRLGQISEALAKALRRRVQEHRQRVEWLSARLQQQHPLQGIRQQQQRLDDLEQRLRVALRLILRSKAMHLNALGSSLAHHSPAVRLAQIAGRYRQLGQELQVAMGACLQRSARALEGAARTLDAVSPLATLHRGYAIVTRDRDQALVRSHRDVDMGEAVHIRLARDQLGARITDLETDPDATGDAAGPGPPSGPPRHHPAGP